MKMKNVMKLSAKAFIILLFVSFLVSCDSAEAEKDTQQEQEQEEQIQQSTEKVLAFASVGEVKNAVAGETLRMIGDKVNMRSEPSLDGEILAQLRINEVFEIKGKTDATETIQTQTDYWYQIEKDGKDGWIFGALITETLNEKENADEAEAATLEIWGDKVNIRSKPSLKGDVIMQLNNGEVVYVKKQTEEYETINYDTDCWYQIEVDGKRGWVFGTFTSRQLVYEGCSG